MIKAQIFMLNDDKSFDIQDYLEIEFDTLKAAFDYIQDPFWRVHAARFVISEIISANN